MNSSAVLLDFSFEREHRPDWRMAFGKRPFPCEMGPNAQDEMDMVAHDGIAADIDREDRGKLLEPLADPFLAVLVIMPGFDVEPTKERPANASRDAMTTSWCLTSGGCLTSLVASSDATGQQAV